ncbi:MAG: ABC transporter substrate-binding protein [Actinomycetota bacterium]
MLRRRGLAILLVPVIVLACRPAGEDRRFPARRPQPRATSPSDLVIGLVGSMSGPGSWRGEDAFEGADVAVNVLNRGEQDGPPFELVTRDDRGDPARAARLVRELAASNQTVGIVYAGSPRALPRVEDALAAAGIPAFLCYGDLYGARALTPHVFQMAPSLLWQARRIASYLVRDRRYRAVGVLAEASASVTVRRAFGPAVRALGASSPRVLTYRHGPQVERVLADRLATLERRRVEAVVVEGTPDVFADVLAILDRMGARYRSRSQARGVRSAPGAPGGKTSAWRPQVVGTDLTLSPRAGSAPPGTVAADTYARGAHYLPVPSFSRFRRAFTAWWDAPALGWERRAYEAASMIGWAARTTGRTVPEAGDEEAELVDLAVTVEGIRDLRFGGLDVTFGPDDHTAVTETTVGLWVVPAARADVRERDRLPSQWGWVPLSRGFSIDGERTAIRPEDWRYLFRKAPPRDGPAPRITRMRFGVATTRRDPIH